MPAEILRFVTRVCEDDVLTSTATVERVGTEFFVVYPAGVATSADGPFDSHAEALEFAVGLSPCPWSGPSGYNLGPNRR